MKKTIVLIGMMILLISFAYATLEDGLIGAYNLDDNTSVIIGPDLAELNAPSYVAGINGNAIDCSSGRLFDSTNYYGANLGTEFTINWWTTQPSIADAKYMITAYGDADRLYLRTTSSAFSYGIQGDGGSGSESGTYYTVALNSWYMHTIMFNGSNFYIYVNGTKVINYATGIDPANWAPTKAITFCGFTLGLEGYDFPGLIDEIYIYDRSLTDLEIQELATGVFLPLASDTTPPTYSGLENNGTDKQYGESVVFNVSLSDEIALDAYCFAQNQSGIMTNTSCVDIDGLNYIANETIIITVNSNKTICGQFWVNDTSGNENQTGLSCFNTTATGQVLKLFISNNQHEKKIMLYNNGDAYFNGTVTVGTLVDASLPMRTSPLFAYSQIINWDTDTVESLHKTAPIECRREYGYDALCTIKILANSFQYIEKRLNLLQTEKIEQSKEIDKLKIENRDLKNIISSFEITILEVKEDIIDIKTNISMINKTNTSITPIEISK